MRDELAVHLSKGHRHSDLHLGPPEGLSGLHEEAVHFLWGHERGQHVRQVCDTETM